MILHEDPALGWYDRAAPLRVARVARDLGARVEVRQTGGPDNGLLDPGEARPSTDAQDLRALIDEDYDCCIFFARIGDQLRFDRAEGKRVVCYVASIDSLASDYCRVDYEAMADLKTATDALLLSAGAITISCALGTDLRGATRDRAAEAQDVTVLRFPVGVHVPIDASSFSGDVRLARWLTPTGSRVYDPAWVELNAPVTAKVEAGRIAGYAGDPRDVDRVERHYDQVARQFSIDRDVIHSWHAGIHPGCRFVGAASDNPDRWSNTVFTNPRFVHFHTCGSYAPGEICWMVLDPTICLDGVALWENGVLKPERFTPTRRCLDRWPSLQTLFAAGNGELGLGGAESAR